MKKISISMILLLAVAAATAQYKKASFFEKTGRTYGFNGKVHAMGDGKGSPVGINVSFGRDQEGKRVFTFWDLSYVPGYKFTFNTANENGDPLTITGKSSAQIVYSYNTGYHLLKNEEGRIIQPYLTWGIHFVLFGGANAKNISDDDYHTNDKVVSKKSFTGGLGGGAGVLFNVTPGFGFKLEGGYTYMANLSLDIREDAKDYYHMYTSHPYVTAGVRFRIVSE